MVTMFVFGMLANAARHEPEAIAALRQHGQGAAGPAAAAAAAASRYRPPVLPPGRPPAGRERRAGDRSSPVVVVAGGGSAGHIEPALALADAVRRLRPGRRAITALGTERGLDTTLIPARGYPLELIPPVPLPRKPSADLLRLPGGCARAVAPGARGAAPRSTPTSSSGSAATSRCPPTSAPAAACRSSCTRRTPGPGLANKVGARFAARVAAAVPGSGLPGAEVLGIPLRRVGHRAGPRRAARAGPGALRPARRRPGAAGLRRLAGRPHAQHGARPPRCPSSLRAGHRGAARARQGAAAPAAPAARLRRRCPTSSGWTWPTPPPTPCSAGPAR